jgi:hypothetical protein
MRAIPISCANSTQSPRGFSARAHDLEFRLAGVCPAPGAVDVGFVSPSAMIFAAAMAIGMLASRLTDLRLRAPRIVTQDARASRRPA